MRVVLHGATAATVGVGFLVLPFYVAGDPSPRDLDLLMRFEFLTGLGGATLVGLSLRMEAFSSTAGSIRGPRGLVLATAAAVVVVAGVSILPHVALSVGDPLLRSGLATETFLLGALTAGLLALAARDPG